MRSIFTVLGFVLGALALLKFMGIELDLMTCGGIMLGSVFSCAAPPSRSCDDCPEDELNKVVHVGFVKRGTSIGTATITTDLLAAELAGNAYIIRNVSGSYDGGKGTYGKGLGKQLKRLTSKAHQLSFIDFNYVSNAAFWSDMEASASNYDLYFFTDTKGWVVQNAFVSIEATGKVTDDNTTFIEADILVTWVKTQNPLPYTTDVDSLATCQLLFDGNSVSFANISGSTATIVTGATDEIDGVHASTVVNARLNTGLALSAVEVVDGTLPAGLTLGYTGNFITLTGTPTTSGTSTVIIRGSNATGVAGEKTVRFVIS